MIRMDSIDVDFAADGVDFDDVDVAADVVVVLLKQNQVWILN